MTDFHINTLEMQYCLYAIIRKSDNISDTKYQNKQIIVGVTEQSNTLQYNMLFPSAGDEIDTLCEYMKKNPQNYEKWKNFTIWPDRYYDAKMNNITRMSEWIEMTTHNNNKLGLTISDVLQALVLGFLHEKFFSILLEANILYQPALVTILCENYLIRDMIFYNRILNDDDKQSFKYSLDKFYQQPSKTKYMETCYTFLLKLIYKACKTCLVFYMSIEEFMFLILTLDDKWFNPATSIGYCILLNCRIFGKKERDKFVTLINDTLSTEDGRKQYSTFINRVQKNENIQLLVLRAGGVITDNGDISYSITNKHLIKSTNYDQNDKKFTDLPVDNNTILNPVILLSSEVIKTQTDLQEYVDTSDAE